MEKTEFFPSMPKPSNGAKLLLHDVAIFLIFLDSFSIFDKKFKVALLIFYKEIWLSEVIGSFTQFSPSDY
ncbi:hypothetical protein JJC04_10640 [Flavobacterium covae]|nr:hypothetical protein JJC04_10620 [Flavobacterium covae]QYS90524.1 hypothetical protein JJC04_10640 [Flavobacterium covae]